MKRCARASSRTPRSGHSHEWATPQNEERLLGFAQAGTAHHVERVVRAWRGIDARKELQRDTARHGKRYFRIYTDDDGMVVIRGRLTPEVGAVVMRALEAAQDKLYLEQEQNVPAGTPEVEQNRADALALVAEAALEQVLDPKTRGDRYQVVVHVDEPALANPISLGSLS